MAHVQIKQDDKHPGGFALLVDGVDLTGKVYSDGFRIETSDDPLVPFKVSLVIAADTVDVDLPESVLSVLRGEDES